MKKQHIRSRALSIALSLAMVLTLVPALTFPAGAVGGTWNGNGTEADPFLIEDDADLSALATNVNAGNTYAGCYFQMTADIDLSDYGATYDGGEGWIPIGYESDLLGTTAFQGIFDGDGYAIKNLYINRTDAGQGLFGALFGATIKNLGLVNCDVTGGAYTGGLIGQTYATVEQNTIVNPNTIVGCYVMGDIESTGRDVGALCGSLYYASVEQCFATGSVTSTTGFYIGGLIGNSAGSSIRDCYTNSTVTGDTVVGGVVGNLPMSGTFQRLIALGSAEATTKTVGGVVGGNGIIIGTVSAFVAIGSNVECPDTTQTGRVVGLNAPTGYAYALETMTVNGAAAGTTGASDRNGEDITVADIVDPDFWEGIGFSDSVWLLEAGSLPLLLVNLSAQRPDYRLNGVDGNWADGDITMNSNDDELVILADSGPDAAVKINVTAPDDSTVTIIGQEDVTYANVYITAANENITLMLEHLCIAAPEDQVGLTLSGGGTIVVSGMCSVEGGEKTSTATQPQQLSAGIYSYGDLTVSGASVDDVFSATGGSSDSSVFSPDGVVVQGDIEIIDVTAEFFGSEGTSSSALGGNGLYTLVKGSLTLERANLLALGGNGSSTGGNGVYLTEGTLTSTDSSATFIGRDSQNANGGMGIVIYMSSTYGYRDVEIKGSDIIAVGGSGIGGGYGINTSSKIFSLTEESTLEAIGGDGTGSGAADYAGDGIRAITDTGHIVVDDSQLYATGGNNENCVGGNGIASCALTLTNGGEVNALGGDSNSAGNGGIGVYTYFGTAAANVSVGDDCELTATGGGALTGAAGAGLLCDAIAIDGGAVDITGGNSRDANGGIGLRSLTGNIEITGGDVSIIGGDGDTGVTGNSGGRGAHAVYADAGTVSISGGADVFITGGDAGSHENNVGGVGIRAYNAENGSTVTIASDAGDVYIRGGMGASARRASIMGDKIYIATGNVGEIMFEASAANQEIKNISGGDDVYMLTVDTDPIAALTPITAEVATSAIGLTPIYTYSATPLYDGIAYLWLPAGEQTLSASGYVDGTEEVTSDNAAAITLMLPSDDASLVTVAGQSITVTGTGTGTDADPYTAAITVSNGTSTITLAGIVPADDATANLYSDNAFSANEDASIALSVGDNHVYIKVTAQDGTTIAYYDVTVTRRTVVSGGDVNITTPTTPKVTIEQPDNGEITATPTSPSTGTEVIITVIPDEDYQVDSVIVTDQDGNQLEVTDRGDGTYSFTYSGSPVTIEAELVPLSSGHDCPSEHFVDVDQSLWYHEAVDYVIVNGIMQGTSANTFQPNANLTRAMMAQMLYNLEGQPSAGASSFTDVDTSAWYSDAVAWAEEAGIVEGIGGGLFAPDEPVTREQMAAMLYRYCGYKGIELPVVNESGSFVDAADISEWAYEAVETMYKAGILTGKGNNVFDPQGTATRAEVAQMFMNFMEIIK